MIEYLLNTTLCLILIAGTALLYKVWYILGVSFEEEEFFIKIPIQSVLILIYGIFIVKFIYTLNKECIIKSSILYFQSSGETIYVPFTTLAIIILLVGYYLEKRKIRRGY